MSGVVHGGVTAGELARAAADGIELVDLSASLNPNGPHPAVVQAAREAVLQRYPESDAATLRSTYAERHGLAASSVLAGNGSTELLYLAARALMGPALIVSPTFGEYRAACAAAGLETHELRPPPAMIVHEVSAVTEAIRIVRPGLVFLCNPNNPTGQLWSHDEVSEIASEVRGCGGHLLIDEAYLDFAYPAGSSWAPGNGVLVLRSMTKMHAIPGLRVGFLLGDGDVIAKVAAQQPAWSVSAPAAAAAMEALRQEDWELDSRRRVAATRDALRTELRCEGFTVGPSVANFLLVEVGDAAGFRARMLKQGWVVRDCSSFGLPSHVRIAVPGEKHVEQFLHSLKECRE